MRRRQKVYWCLGIVGCMIIAATMARAGLNMDFRIIANDCDGVYSLRADNQTDEAITLQGPYLPDLFEYRVLHEPPGPRNWRRQHPVAASWKGNITIPPGKMLERYFKRMSLMLYMPELANAYSEWRWRYGIVAPRHELAIVEPPTLYLGYVPAGGGKLKTPNIEPGSGVSNLLAFVFYENRSRGQLIENTPPHELAFLLLNGTAEPLETPPPLSAESILHLTAPGIGYSTNITLGSSGFKAKTIPAGECGQWRIPFEQILAQIPKATVEAIRVADGKLDLVWKTGDIESPLLPLILLPPTQGELDAQFLAKHADVPRIDENTDLSLDLRLAGIDDNKPVLLGTMRNNEKHNVLIDNSVNNSVLDSTLDAFYFSRLGYGRKPFLLKVNDPVLFLADLSSLKQHVPEDERLGRMVCYGWRSTKRWSNMIWILDAKMHNQVDQIHTYANKYLPISECSRPPLPSVAPLLAYVYNPETPPELTCVLWNRTEEPIRVAKSRIIATNAALGYRRELALPAGLQLPVEVAPGSHTDWRVAWSEIIEQIPSRDLARIKATDGKLDFVWRVGEHASPPLPLLLGWQGNAE